MTDRHDMLVELVTDQINSIEQMIRDDEYDDVHRWLHPILLRELKLDYADWTDEQLQDYYNDQLGVDTPSSPPLSSADAEEEIYSQAEETEIGLAAEKAKLGSMPELSGLDHFALSLFHPISHAKSLGEVAPKSPVPTTVETSLPWY